MASEQKERTVQGVLVGHEVVCGHGVGQNLIPLKWTVLEPFPSAVFQEAVSSFQFSIPLRMVWTCEYMVEVKHFGNFTEQLVLEFCTIVSEDAHHATFACVEVCDEAVCDMISTFVAQWDCP